MTELRTFLTSLYDALSEAEMQALEHGQARLAELLSAGAVPPDAAVPVYHATDVEVTLAVGLRTEETEEGLTVFVTEQPPAGEGSRLTFTVELFDLLDRTDLQDVDLADLLPPSAIDEILEGVERGGEDDGNGDGRADDGRDDDGPTVPAGTDLPVERVEGIGPAYGGRLREAGVERVSQLLALTPAEIADLVGTETAPVSTERTEDWLVLGREKLRAAAEAEDENGGADDGEDDENGGADDGEDDENGSVDDGAGGTDGGDADDGADAADADGTDAGSDDAPDRTSELGRVPGESGDWEELTPDDGDRTHEDT